jgi:hypothetical protein
MAAEFALPAVPFPARFFGQRYIPLLPADFQARCAASAKYLLVVPEILAAIVTIV